MATNLPFCFFIQFLEQRLKFLVNFTLLKYVKSQRSYGFLIIKELIFGFQILDLKGHFSASLKSVHFGHVHSQLFAPVNTSVHGKVLSLSYHAIVIFEQLILYFKGSFSRECISRNHGYY